MADTTTRYRSSATCSYPNHKIQAGDIYQFGCELEFYIDTDRHKFTEAVDAIRCAVAEITDVDILVDLTYLPDEPDRYQCIQIKPDNSLDGHGIEINTPITSRQGIKHYLTHLLPLIEQYGYTNADTGLHFHISTVQTDGVNLNFYLYMLMCHERGLLSSWAPRTGYSHNVMDILLKHTKAEARTKKTEKGTVWNLEKIAPNRIEIKTIGGTNYHQNAARIIGEFEEYAGLFDLLRFDRKPVWRAELIAQHKNLVASTPKEAQSEFSKAIAQTNLMATGKA
ncbi:MAG: hypothetical protein JXK05_12940 [Campylobacterales bacterium]|nr:hypothetical protein [Campylobacterales bacterium]